VRIRDGAASTRREREEWATRLRKEGGTLSIVGPDPEPNPDSIVRVLSNGKLGYCRAGHVRRDNNLDSLLIVDVIDAPEWCPVSTRDRSSLAGNTWVLRDPRSTPVGDTLSACAFLGGPRRYRFDVIAFYTDRLRCRPDPDDEQQAEPNMVLLRRVE
jgi:hypothetical protein